VIDCHVTISPPLMSVSRAARVVKRSQLCGAPCGNKARETACNGHVAVAMTRTRHSQQHSASLADAVRTIKLPDGRSADHTDVSSIACRAVVAVTQ